MHLSIYLPLIATSAIWALAPLIGRIVYLVREQVLPKDNVRAALHRRVAVGLITANPFDERPIVNCIVMGFCPVDYFGIVDPRYEMKRLSANQ